MTTLFDTTYTLDDRYAEDRDRVFLNGHQALVRLLLMQHRRDKLAGLHTGGFVSGYRGSPLGVLDLALWGAEKRLREADIKFWPGVNEELAATAVWGTQQLDMVGGGSYDGVFGMWYGKGPGVDRASDALKDGQLRRDFAPRAASSCSAATTTPPGPPPSPIRASTR